MRTQPKLTAARVFTQWDRGCHDTKFTATIAMEGQIAISDRARGAAELLTLS